MTWTNNAEENLNFAVPKLGRQRFPSISIIHFVLLRSSRSEGSFVALTTRMKPVCPRAPLSSTSTKHHLSALAKSGTWVGGRRAPQARIRCKQTKKHILPKFRLSSHVAFGLDLLHAADVASDRLTRCGGTHPISTRIKCQNTTPRPP